MLLEYLKKYQVDKQGSVKKEIIEHNLRIVSYMARRYVSKNISYEDLISIGTIGLIKAIDNFDISKGNEFVTYASHCIENEILRSFRSIKKSQNDVSLNDSIGFDKDDKALLIEDTLVDESINLQEDFINNKELIENKEKISNILKTFSERDKFIVTKYYGLDDNEPLSQRKIAKELGISQAQVSKILSRCIKKFQEEMPKQNRRFDCKNINNNLSEEIFFDLLKILPKRDRLLYCKYRGIILYNRTILITNEKEYSNNFLTFMGIIENDLNYMFIYFDKLINNKHLSEERAYDELKKHMFKHFLRFRFEKYTQKEIFAAVKQLPINYQKVIFLRYGNNLCSFNKFPKNSQNLYNKLSIAHKKLKDILDKKVSEIYPKSIRGKYPNKTLEELKGHIERLPKNYQNVIYLHNGENLDKWISFPKDKPYQSYYNLYTKATLMLDDIINGIEVEIKEKKTIINTYKMEDLLYAIQKLSLEDRNLAYYVHGENLDQNNSLPESPEEKSKSYYYQKYLNLYPKIDNILLKKSEIQKNNDFITNKLGDYTYEEVINAMKELPDEMYNVIIVKHGKNLDEYNPWPNNKPFNYYKELYDRAIVILKNILKRIKYPELYEQEQNYIDSMSEQRRIGRQVKKNKRKSELVINLFTKEDIIWAVEFLSKLQKDILYLRHGENLDRTISWPPIPKGKKSTYYISNYYNMRKRLKYIIEHKEEFINNKNKVKKKINIKNSIIDIIPNDKLIKLAPKLPKIQREIFYLRHGENLDQIFAWPPVPEGKCANYYYVTYNLAVKNINKMLADENKKIMSLDKTKEQLEETKKVQVKKDKKNKTKKNNNSEENSIKKEKRNDKKKTYIEAKNKLEKAKLNNFAYSLYREYNNIYGSLIDGSLLENIIKKAILSFTYEEGLALEISIKFKIETEILLYFTNIYRQDPDSEESLEILLLIENIFGNRLKERFGNISEEKLSKAVENVLKEYTGEKLFSTEIYVNYRKLTR